MKRLRMAISRKTTKTAHDSIDDKSAGSNDPLRPASSVDNNT